MKRRWLQPGRVASTSLGLGQAPALHFSGSSSGCPFEIRFPTNDPHQTGPLSLNSYSTG